MLQQVTIIFYSAGSRAFRFSCFAGSISGNACQLGFFQSPLSFSRQSHLLQQAAASIPACSCANHFLISDFVIPYWIFPIF